MSVLQIYSRSLDGHRAEYISLISAEARALGAEPKVLTRITLRALGQPLLFAMLDEDLPTFLTYAVLAPLLGQKVAGLFFRPGECFGSSVKHQLKGVIFKALKALRLAQVITILPPTVDARFKTVSSGWVHDPQLWDTLVSAALDPEHPSALVGDVKREAAGRKIMVALGAQNRIKGFNYFCELWKFDPRLSAEYLFVAAGRVATESQAHATAFAGSGGMLVDRFISNAELHDLYETADLIWATYAPDYNQASGIAGRAYQKGVPVCVRTGSYIGDEMNALKHSVVEIGFDNLEADTAILRDVARARCERPIDAMEQMRARFRDFLRDIGR